MIKSLFVVALALSAVACSKGGEAAPGTTPASGAKSPASAAATKAAPASTAATEAAPASTAATEAAAAGGGEAETEANTIFAQRCTACHGPEGKGDGPAAAALNPKPAAFGDAAWQASVTDEHLAKVIVGGGPAVGKSPMMAPNPDLGAADKKAVLDALVKRVRSFGTN